MAYLDTDNPMLIDAMRLDRKAFFVANARATWKNATAAGAYDFAKATAKSGEKMVADLDVGLADFRAKYGRNYKPTIRARA